jgi:O-antigen/teichoic acid export membrane protein
MSLRRSLVIVFVSSNSITAIGLVSSMIIARLQTPKQIGTFAVASVLIGIAHQFRDFGVSNYLIHTPVLDRETQAKAFGLTLSISWALALLVFFLSYPFAQFYDSPEVGATLRVLAFNFLLVPFGSITLALLRREMRFKERALIDHVSALSGMIASVFLSYRGMGALALAWGTVCSTAGTILATLPYRSSLTSWIPCFRGMRKIATYGATVTAGTLLAQINRGAVEMIGGKLLSMEAVGLFNKSRAITDQIGALIIGAASQISLPVLSARHREGENIAPLYLKAIALLSALTWPACAFAALFPVEILRIMFGPQWDAAAQSLRILSLIGIMSSPFWLWTNALYAIGEQNSALKGELFSLTSTVIIVVSLLSFSSVSLAQALLISTPVGLLYIHSVLTRALGYSAREFARSLVPSAIVTAVSLSGPLALNLLFPALPAQARLLISGPLALTGWVAGLFLSRHPFSIELKRLIPGRQGGDR